MILSDLSIKSRIASEEIDIRPFELDNVQPAGVDLRISNKFKYYVGDRDIDPHESRDEQMSLTTVGEDGYTLRSQQFALGSTVEWVKIPDNITAKLDDRSSIARLGLDVQTAGRVEPGFEGDLTLELFNKTDRAITIYPGMRVCQMVFEEVDQPPEATYTHKVDNKYQGQSGPTESRVDQDYDTDGGNA